MKYLCRWYNQNNVILNACYLGGSIEHEFGKIEWERNEDAVQEYHEGIGSRILQLSLWQTDYYFIRDDKLTVSSSCYVLWPSDIARVSGGLAIDEAPSNILVRCTRDFCLRSWSEIGLLGGQKGLEKRCGVADGHTNVSRSLSTVELISGSFV